MSRKATGASYPAVSDSVVRGSTLPLPPLSEQRRIAAILDQADELRTKRRAALAALDGLAQAVFVEMFGDPISLGSKWNVLELGSVLDYLTSGSRGWAAHYAESGDLFLRIQNVGHDELRMDDVAFVKAPDTAEARRTKVASGDVLLSITADLGRTAVVPVGLGPAFINQHLAIVRTRAFVPRFLSAYLSSPSGQSQVLSKNRQGVKAGLNFDDIRSLRIPCPPISRQQEFSLRMDSLAAFALQQRRSTTSLDALFASIQYRAFAGEL
jgi:type I restriction enzyme S subunit